MSLLCDRQIGNFDDGRVLYPTRAGDSSGRIIQNLNDPALPRRKPGSKKSGIVPEKAAASMVRGVVRGMVRGMAGRRTGPGEVARKGGPRYRT